MYLKAYGVKKMIPIAKELLELALGFNTEREVLISIDEKGRYIEISDDCFILTINADGEVTFESTDGIKIDIANLKRIMHLLAETQWRDPKVEMPEQDQEVFIKTSSGINRATYYVDKIDHGKQLFDLEYMQINHPYILPAKDVDFWLPADNVIL